MYKGELDIEKDIYVVARDFFGEIIGGDVYRDGCRPNDSQDEDACIAVSTSSANQVQKATAYVNVYVPDLRNARGRYVPDKARMAEIAAYDESFIEALNDAYIGEYDFYFAAATSTHAVPDIGQHFVSISLSILRVTF